MLSSLQKMQVLRYQRGVTLAMTLIILLMLIILGTTVIQTVILGEKSASARLDQEQSFQSAENTVKQCWNLLGVNSTTNDRTGDAKILNVTSSRVFDVSPSSADWTNNAVNPSDTSNATAFARATAAPRCLIEKIDVLDSTTGAILPDPAYRITGQGAGRSSQALTTVQATFFYK